jgi:hypothetical protein
MWLIPLVPLPRISEFEIIVAKLTTADMAMRIASGAMKAVRDEGHGHALHGTEALRAYWRGMDRQIKAETPYYTLRGWMKVSQAADRIIAGDLAKDCLDVGHFDQALQDLMCCKPSGVTVDEWAICIQDASEFVGTWGDIAFQRGWRADDIFGAPRVISVHDGARASGIAWILAGRRVQSLGGGFARIGHGQTVFARDAYVELGNAFSECGYVQ